MRQRINWDEYFMEAALLISRRSTCLRRAVGAVLVKNNKIISTGYNGAPKGLKHCYDRGCYRQNNNIPSGKCAEACIGLHGEQNAIIQAATSGVDITGSILYCTTFPCSICAKMLINSGVKEIYYYEDYTDKLSIQLLTEAGIGFFKWRKK